MNSQLAVIQEDCLPQTECRPHDMKVKIKTEVDELAIVDIKCEPFPADDPLASDETNPEMEQSKESPKILLENPHVNVTKYDPSKVHFEDGKVNDGENNRAGRYTLIVHSKTGDTYVIHFKCSICDKTFSSLSKLNTHLLDHNEEPLKCSRCDKSFVSRSSLNKHSNYHSNKPFKCSHCNKTFNYKHDIESHILIHSKDKPFKCSICYKSFDRNWHLETHFRIHTKEKPFKCSVCNNSFVQKSNLVRHYRFHTNEKPFKCSVCNKSFTAKLTLTKHKCIHK